MANMDSISIELTADVSSAESSINRLIGTLGRLKSAVSGASDFNKVVRGIASIAAVASGIDGSAGKKLSDLAAGISALSNAGDLSNLKGAGKTLASVLNAMNRANSGAGLNGLANSIRNTGEALNSITQTDVDKLGAIHDALAGETSGPLHTNDRVSESAALGGMETEPSFGNMAAYGAMTVFTYVADSIRDATAAYQEFQAALSGGTTIETSFADDAQNMASSAQALGGSVPAVYGAMTVFRYVADSVRDAANAYNEYAGGIAGQSEVIETNFVDVGDAAENMSDRVRRATDDVIHVKPQALLPEHAGAAIEDVANEANNAGATFGFLRTHIVGLTGVTGGLVRGLTAIGQGLVAIPKFFGGQLIGNIQKATKGLTGFFHSIVRIAKYRLIRAALRMITQGFSEGIKNLYTWSSAVNGSFAASMDRLATASKYLKNSLGAMASPLIEAVAPVVDWIVDKFVDMFNTINQLISRLTGKSTYTAAKKVASTWGDAADSAAGSAREAADEIKRTLLALTRSTS